MMRKILSMREALGSPLYFADLIGGPSWAAWRVLLIAIVGEELTDDERVIFEGRSASDCPGRKIRKRDEAGVRSTRFSDIRRSREAQTRGRCGNHEVVRRAVVQRASG
jgi:hypothetical protein